MKVAEQEKREKNPDGVVARVRELVREYKRLRGLGRLKEVKP